MSQVLQLIQKGNRELPTIYLFGSDTFLYLYQNSLINEIKDNNGTVKRLLDSHQLMKMGYSPAKLARGETMDQFIDDNSESISSKLSRLVKQVLIAGVAGVAIAMISNITGCTTYVLKQVDKDIATTSIAPVDNYNKQIEFKQANEHANKYLATINRIKN